jgi:hypothetical protein
MANFDVQTFYTGQVVSEQNMNATYNGKDQNLTAYFPTNPCICNGITISQATTTNVITFGAGVFRFKDQVNANSGAQTQATFGNYAGGVVTVTAASGSGSQLYIVAILTQTVVDSNNITNTVAISPTSLTLAQIAAESNPNAYLIISAITNTAGVYTLFYDSNCVLNYDTSAVTATAITVTNTASGTYDIPLITGSSTGNYSLYVASGMTFNTATSALSATTFIGALTGASTQVGTTNNTSNAFFYMPFVAASTTGNQALQVSVAFRHDPNIGYSDITGSAGGFAVINNNATPAAGYLSVISNPAKALISTNQLGIINFEGAYNNANGLNIGARIIASATQTYSITAAGTNLQFYTTPNNSITNTLALTLGQDQSATFANNVTATAYYGDGSNLTGISGIAFTQQGRLTDTTATPNGGNSSSGSTTLYFTPSYNGNQITLYNGTAWVTQTFAEINLAVNTLTSGDVYDVYITSASSTTVTMSVVAWSGNTPPTRDTQNGRLVKHSTPTALLVGTIYTPDGTHVYSWNGQRYINNFYNQIELPLFANDTTASWTYASTSQRAANGNTTYGQGRFGALFDPSSCNSVNLTNFQSAGTGTGTNQYYFILGIDSTTALTAASVLQMSSTGYTSSSFTYNATALVGFHYFQRCETSNTGGGQFFGSNSGGVWSGLFATILG